MSAPDPLWGPNPLHLVSPDDVRWTTVNVGEVLPGVMTPLTVSLWGEHVEKAGKEVWRRLGLLSRDEAEFSLEPGRRLWGITFGRAALSVTLMREIGNRMPGSSADALEEQLLGAKTPDAVASRTVRTRYPVIAARFPATAALATRRVRRVRAENDLWWRQVVAAPPEGIPAARRLIRDSRRRFESTMVDHVVVTTLSQGVYEQLHAAVEGAGWAEGTVLDLTTGYGSMEETQVLADLFEVSQGTRTLEAFLEVHGYHGRGEGEVCNPSWREDPAQLDHLLERFAELPAERAPRTVEAARVTARLAAEESLLGSLRGPRRYTTKAILTIARNFIPLREVGKVAFLQTIDATRIAVREIGRSLAQQGQIDEPGDVFYLTLNELDEDLPAGVTDLVAERRRTRDLFQSLELPKTWLGEPKAVEATAAPSDSDVVRVTGLGVSAGVVEGPVRVVRDPDDEIAEGDILVCDTTDPSWAPLLFLAAGMIVNVGGALSHAAIVARELGTPCVINTLDGTRQLRDGDHVRIDGRTGEVELLVPS